MHTAFKDPCVRDAAERALRLISYDRPGFGESSPQPGRTAADVRAICAELGIDRLVTWGYSGGGPHLLACAALLPDLVTAAASLAGLAPFDAEGPRLPDGCLPGDRRLTGGAADRRVRRPSSPARRSVPTGQSGGLVSRDDE